MPEDKFKDHAIANKLTPMRISLEKFIMDYLDLRFKDRCDKQILNEAIVLMQETIVQIDDLYMMME